MTIDTPPPHASLSLEEPTKAALEGQDTGPIQLLAEAGAKRFPKWHSRLAFALRLS